MQRFLARSLRHGIPLAVAALPLDAQQPCFSSTGGPNGDFDWVVRTGEFFFFDTTRTVVIGGPNGIPSVDQIVIGGEIEVRNLVVEPGAVIRVQGPNPMRIQASGDVVVRGRIDLSGFNAKDVATLNTGHQFELGGAGGPSGGDGGIGNVVTTDSSPRGGPGFGPFDEIGTGGQGGESGYAPANLGKDARRPGGGGGARFAADRPQEAPATGFSLVATDGNDGNPQSTGAESGMSPAQGGAAGLGAFDDDKPENDFFGLRPIVGPRGRLRGLIRGELSGLWGGYGGGAGGNAIPAASFPNPDYSFSTDEKGGGGGGGGGTLHVQALGRILFGAEGEIRTNGGRGGTGENTSFVDHIGGTGGAGSGGHVVLESAQQVDFTDGGANASAQPRDWITAYGLPIRTGPVDFVNPCCRTNSNGGASGGGVLQLHVPNPIAPPGANPVLADIVVPDAVAALRNPLAAVSSPQAYALFPTCGPLMPLVPRDPGRDSGFVDLGARGTFMRLTLDDVDLGDLASELVQIELPRRY